MSVGIRMSHSNRKHAAHVFYLRFNCSRRSLYRKIFLSKVCQFSIKRFIRFAGQQRINLILTLLRQTNIIQLSIEEEEEDIDKELFSTHASHNFLIIDVTRAFSPVWKADKA